MKTKTSVNVIQVGLHTITTTKPNTDFKRFNNNVKSMSKRFCLFTFVANAMIKQGNLIKMLLSLRSSPSTLL